MKNKTNKFILPALLTVLVLAVFASFQSSQFVQIPVPTDVTPPLGHGYEKLRTPTNSNCCKHEKRTEPVEVTYLGSMSFRHLDNAIITEDASGIAVSDDEAIVTASENRSTFTLGTVSSQVNSIVVNDNSITQVIVDKAANTITIRALHKQTQVVLHVITAAVGHADHPIILTDGQEITLPIRSSYRSVYLTGAQLDSRVKTSDFVSIVKASPVLQRMRNSYNKNDRRIYQTAEKTAAALRQVH